MTIEALRKSLQSPYGIQSLNTHDIERAIEEFETLKEQATQTESTPVTGFGQINAGDFILISDGKITFPAEVKCVIRPGTVEEEVIISRRKNIYFISHMMLDGTSWVKAVSVVKNGRIFNYSNTMKDYNRERD